MRRGVVTVLALLALPVLWFGYRWYDLSVRHGTSDPCEMIAERLTEETMKAVDPLGLDRLLNVQRPSHLAQEARRVREHGALACWLSVLFSVPTRTEEIHAVIMEANSIERLWRGDETSRRLAVLSTALADVEVIEQLLRDTGGEGQSALRAALNEDDGGRLGAKLEAAVREVCSGVRLRAEDETRDACVRRNYGLVGYSPPPRSSGNTSSSDEPPRRAPPTESERADAIGRNYVAAGLATEFTVEAETLRLTTTLYPEALARNVCRKLPTGWQVAVYHPDRERPVAQCDGRIP